MARTLVQDRRKIRVWTNEALPCAYQAAHVKEQSFEAGPVARSGDRQAAIELLHYVPGRPLYGLLGASFTPTQAAQLVVQIAVSSGEDEPAFADSLAVRLDQVAIGLPLEYVDGVTTGILEAEAWRALGPGVLYFGWAAHGAVGSSREVFRRLSADLVRLLTVEDVPNGDAELAALLQAVNQ